MSLGAAVRDLLTSLGPDFGAVARWRVLDTREQVGGTVEADLRPIVGAHDDARVIVTEVNRARAQRTFGADTQATAEAVVSTTLPIVEGHRLLLTSGPLAGTQYEVVARRVIPAGEVAILGLAQRPARQDWY